MKTVRKKSSKVDANSGLKMVGGAAAGAAAGSLIGPVGAAVGAVVGGLAGANSRKLAAFRPAKQAMATTKKVAVEAKKKKVVKRALAKVGLTASPARKRANSTRAKTKKGQKR